LRGGGERKRLLCSEMLNKDGISRKKKKKKREEEGKEKWKK